ncbi:hypothetical protein DFR49_1792 [Hephaestia caeni]|uniref:Uncharacterized protein n=1 Tax=Hephaestia caeni TaxID=645617 RepID=A0A397P6B8_9SPHN|nr:hypothetical protein DFR49_1792 [Hephaestia caeni]
MERMNPAPAGFEEQVHRHPDWYLDVDGPGTVRLREPRQS